MPPGCLPLEVFLGMYPMPRGRPRTWQRDYKSCLVWDCLGEPQEQLENVTGEREVWHLLQSLLSGRLWIDDLIDRFCESEFLHKESNKGTTLNVVFTRDVLVRFL